jgi:hypothetical protein
MYEMRKWMTLTIFWLFFFFNVERIYEPLNIASFVYVVATILAGAVVLIPPLTRTTASWLIGGTTILVIVVKWMLGYSVGGTAIPITVTEALAVTITVVLTSRIATSMRLFEDSVAELTTLHWSSRPSDFEEIEPEVVREVRRARQFERPLSMIVLSPKLDKSELAIHRTIEEIQRRNARQILEARTLQTLRDALHDCDIVAVRNRNFVITLAESDREKAWEIATRLHSSLRSELGLDSRFGIASFPSDEVTLTGLLLRAETELECEQYKGVFDSGADVLGETSTFGAPNSATCADADETSLSTSHRV